jgi:hypothetical protein
VELGIVEPAAPFREATVLVVLEPRDVSVLWAFARSHGRRDFVIVRANLVRPPRFTMDVRDPRGWNVGGEPAAVGAGQADDWRAGDGPPGTITRVSPGGDEGPVRALWDQLAEVTGRVWRVTVQPVVPHLEIHFRPPPVEESSADRVVAPIAELARTLSAR